MFFIIAPLLLWLTRGIWLPPFYAFTVVGEAPQRADVIVILGGDVGGRAETAARLWQEGYAPIIIFSGTTKSLRLGTFWLDHLGVPRDVRRLIENAEATWDEAEKVYALLQAEGAHSALIVTDNTHTRRARAVYRALQPNPPLVLTFVSVDRYDLTEMAWYDHDTFLAVGMEYLKMIYYAMRYGVLPF